MKERDAMATATMVYLTGKQRKGLFRRARRLRK
jgi:hypothetical protein